MPEKISIELNPAGCNKVVKKLASIQAKKDSRMEEVIARVAARGLEIAQELFDKGTQYSGNTNVTVVLEPIPNGYKIVASGQSVYFIEFGTGDAVTNEDPLSEQVNFDIYPGSWSVEHAEMYSNVGYWFYGGKKYTETPAEMPMYNAMKTMREEAVRIAREVLGK